jgi:hypothetical protein
MIYFSWNNFTWVHMFSKYVKFWKYRVDLLMKLWLSIPPKLFYVAGLYILSITPIFSRASYSRCSDCFLIDSSQCLLILWKQLSQVPCYICIHYHIRRTGLDVTQREKAQQIGTGITNGLRYNTVTRWEYTSVFYSNDRHCHSTNC